MRCFPLATIVYPQPSSTSREGRLIVMWELPDSQLPIIPLLVMWELPDSQFPRIPFHRTWLCSTVLTINRADAESRTVLRII
jgi:hypothetical protein